MFKIVAILFCLYGVGLASPVPSTGPLCIVRPQDCEQCDKISNNFGYIRDPCDEKKFHQCIKFGSTWYVYTMTCSPCTVWSAGSHVCAQRQDTCAVHKTAESTVEIIGDDKCIETKAGVSVTRFAHEDKHKFIVDDVTGRIEMPCAPGTSFVLRNCSCTAFSSGNIVPKPKRLACMNLTGSLNKWGFSVPGLWWIGNNNVIPGYEKGAYFNGNAKLEIPFFSNNYARNQFSVVLSYKRESGAAGTMGILTNAACGGTPSISVTSSSGTSLSMAAVGINGDPSVPFTAQVSDGVYHRVAISYNERNITYFVDNQAPVVFQKSGGPLKDSTCPLIIGSSASGENFRGWIRQVCFYEGPLNALP